MTFIVSFVRAIEINVKLLKSMVSSILEFLQKFELLSNSIYSQL